MMHGVSLPSHESMNFALAPRERGCFYEDLEANSARRISAFVLAGKDIQVLLTIHGPLKDEKAILEETFEDPIESELITATREKNSDTQTFVTEFTSPEDGTYAFCLDNREARFFPKFVQIDVTPVVERDPEYDPNEIANKARQENNLINSNNNLSKENTETPNDSTKSNAQIEELKQSLKTLAKIHRGVMHIQRQQQRDRHRLALHSATNNNNYNHVFYGSLIETFIFIFVACFQIYFVRRWFASRAPKKAANWV